MSRPKQQKTKLEEETDFWYKKLKESGFEDIESRNGDIRSCVPRKHRGYAQLLDQMAITEYYEGCREFLNTYQFDSELEKVIWEYHTEGLGAETITKILHKINATKYKRTSIENILYNLVRKMKARYVST